MWAPRPLTSRRATLTNLSTSGEVDPGGEVDPVTPRQRRERDSRAGQRLGPWTLREALGRGAFGVTWRATREDGRQAAVKVLARAPGAELRALARVAHPAVVGLLGAGSLPRPWLAMELAAGRPASEVLGGVGDLILARELGATLMDALAAVHAAGVVHGDVKPANLIVDATGQPGLRLVDFGLAGAAGGTVAYAAPERLRHEAPEAANDVYAAGLVMFEAAVGHLPWIDQPLEEALARRSREAPVLPCGPPWFRELVGCMLSVDPAARPTAAEAADTLEHRGCALPAVDGAFLRRRTRALSVRREAVDPGIEGWLEHGGGLAVLGGPGSGRSHALEWARTELLAQGRPTLWLDSTRPGWRGLVDAAGALGAGAKLLDVPEGADDHVRAAAFVEALRSHLSRDAVVVADDLPELGAATRLVVRRLGELGVPTLVSGTAAPAWIDDVCVLGSLTQVEAAALVGGLLGTEDELHELVALGVAWSGGSPRSLVDFVSAAVEEGCLSRRARRWVWDAAALAAMRPREAGGLPAGSQPGDRELLSLLSVRDGGLPVGTLHRASAPPPAELELALDRLVSEGSIRVDRERAWIPDPRLARALRDAAQDPAALHGRLLDASQGSPTTSRADLARHALGAGRLGELSSVLALAVEDELRRDPVAAAILADSLWKAAPQASLALPRLRALVKAARIDDAEDFAGLVLSEDPPAPLAAEVLIELAVILCDHRADPTSALSALARAREMQGFAPPPDTLLVAEASAAYRAGELELATRNAAVIARRPPPLSRHALERWLRARYLWAQALHEGGDLQRAIEVLESVPDEVGRGLPSFGVLLAALGRLLWFAGRLRDAEAALTRASDEGAGLSLLDRARLVNNLGAVRYSTGDPEGALRAWERAREMFERLEAPLEVVRAEVNLCLGYTEVGRNGRAETAGLAAMEGAEALGAPELTCLAADNMAQLDIVQGRYEAARARLDEATVLAEAHGLTHERLAVALRRAEVAALLEEADALDRAQAVEAEASAEGLKSEAASAAALAGVSHARTGDREAATRAFKRSVEPLRAAGAARELAWARMWIAEGQLALGDAAQAASDVGRARVYAREITNRSLLSRCDALDERVRAAWTPELPDERVERLVALAVAVCERQEGHDVFGAIAEAALELTGGERAAVLVGTPIEVAAQRWTGEARPPRPSMSAVRRAILDDREVFALDIAERGDLRGQQSVVSMSLRSVVCVPMRHRGKPVGAIYVDSTSDSFHALSRVTGLVRGLAALAALSVVNARHFDAEMAHARTRAALEERQRAEVKLQALADALAAKNEELGRSNAELTQANRKLESATQAKSSFLAAMSHELRTPLAGVLGMAHLLEDTQLSGTQRSFVQTICNSADALLGVITDILDFSKIEAQQMELENIPFSLGDCVEQTVDLWAVTAYEKQLEVVVRVDPELPDAVVGDPGRLRQVLLNLCNNAVKFTEGGHISVDVSGKVEGGELRVHVQVDDTGIGIEATDLQRLFKPFAQGDSSTTRRFGGTGLGLAICRQLVQLMDGEMGVQSTPGEGSSFWFTARLGVGAAQPRKTVVRGSGAKRVILVDAWELRRRPLEELLASWQVPVLGVGSVREALTLAERGSVVVVADPTDAAIAPLQALPGVRVVEQFGIHDLPRGAGAESVLSRPTKRAEVRRVLFGGDRARPQRARSRHVDGRPILVVEDNPVNLEIVVRTLERAGFRVDVAHNGREAVAHAEGGRWDLVLMDCQMPEMDGIEATRRIRALGGDWCQIPIIALTANAQRTDREECFEAGMTAYLSKPLQPKDLVATVRQLLSGKGGVGMLQESL